MRKNNNIIEINGKRYDAITGRLLSSHGAPTPAPPKPPAVKPAAKASKRPNARRAAPHNLAARAQAPASTLMRQAVRKPNPAAKRRLKANGHTDTLVAQPPVRVKPKKSIEQLDKQRLQHARRITKSRLVSRFSAGTTITLSAVLSAAQPSQVAKAAPSRRATPKLVKRPKTTADLLEHALQQATSHLQPAPSKYRRGLRRKLHISA